MEGKLTGFDEDLHGGDTVPLRDASGGVWGRER